MKFSMNRLAAGKNIPKIAVLCVDDENYVLQSLKSELIQLFERRYTVEIAESGVEALEVFAEFQKNHDHLPVVISDYIMPGMKGDEFLERIHRQSPRTRKVLLTGQAALEGLTHAINHANLFYYLEKPWKKEDLNAVVDRAVESYFRDQIQADEHKRLNALKGVLEKQTQEKIHEFENSLIELETKESRAALAELTNNFLSFHNLGESMKNIKSNLDFLKESLCALKKEERYGLDSFFYMERAMHHKTSDEVGKIADNIERLTNRAMINPVAK